MCSVNNCPKFCLDTGSQSFGHSFIASLIMLFEVSPEIRCSGVSRRYTGTVVTDTTQLVLSEFKIFLPQSIEN